MEIKSFLFMLRSLSFALLSLVLLGCAMPLKKRGAETVQPRQEGAVLLDQGEPVSSAAEELEPVKALPKVGVVLGPGSAKAFAHAGVLKQLAKNDIKISSIVGVEWGALVAGLYALNPKVNEVEWKLYKLQAKDLKDKGFFSEKFERKTIKDLKPFLTESFGESRINEAAIDFSCPSLSIWTGLIVWQKSGSMSKAVERCLPYPPLFKPSSPWMAGAFDVDTAVDQLKRQGIDLILVFNVLGQSPLLSNEELMAEYSSSILWQEARKKINRFQEEGVILINVNTDKYMLYDFDNRNLLVLAGERAGDRAVEVLREKHGF